MTIEATPTTEPLRLLSSKGVFGRQRSSGGEGGKDCKGRRDGKGGRDGKSRKGADGK